MIQKKSSIVVFEHDSLRIGEGGKSLSKDQLKALQIFYGEKGVPYFSLIHNGVKFNEHVGVIQVGNSIIEILPKADKGNDANMWRKILIGMLHASGMFNIKAPSSADLKVKSNSILDLYFELFINEVEYLLHHGLSKKYRKTEGNCTSLKGSIIFGKNIQYNLVHQERVYAKYTVFNLHHPLNQVLCKAIHLINKLNSNSSLQNRIGAMLLNFPEMDDIRVSEKFFSKIILNRNTMHYQKSLDIAKLLLLNYHPDVSRGNNHVLALMFDMNMLWEKFVYGSLYKKMTNLIPGISITPQTSHGFWRADGARSATPVKPDILIKLPSGQSYVIDTKWKNLDNTTPSVEDLRQLYVYHEYFLADKVAIVYPGNSSYFVKGNYLPPKGKTDWIKECSVLPLKVDPNIANWQQEIAEQVMSWVK